MSTSVNVLNFNVAIGAAAAANVDLARRVFQRTTLMCLGSVSVGDPPYSPGTPVGNPRLWKHPAPPGYVGGFARANWRVFFAGSGTGAADGTAAAIGTDPVAAARAAIAEAKLGDTAWIINTVPYIVRLEYGWSRRQAPAGMVRLTLSAAQEIVDEAMLVEQTLGAA